MTAPSYCGETVMGECKRCGATHEITPESFGGDEGHCPSCEHIVEWRR